jgi:hypothetical protein
MSTRALRLVSLAALLPLLVVAAAGVGYDRLRCRFTGLVEANDAAGDSCCPDEPSSATPVIREARCCDRETAAIAHPPAEPSTVHAAFETPIVSAPLALFSPGAPAARAAVDAATPRAPPTPLRIAKQSFLI